MHATGKAAYQVDAIISDFCLLERLRHGYGRELIAAFGAAAAAWPLGARAQQRAKLARIGYLSSSSPPDVNLESFIRGMGAVGYGEGRDFVIEARYARRDYSKFPALADELLRAQVDLIVAGGPAFRTWRLAAVPVPVSHSRMPVSIP